MAGSLLMFGKRDSVLNALPNFWIDYMEIPGASYNDALQRYTYRMPEQENIWESFQLIMSRLRNFVDAPYIEGPGIFGTEDNSQLFCLREGLVNFCAHTVLQASEVIRKCRLRYRQDTEVERLDGKCCRLQ